jgi:3-oxoacyl-ACP reductase-like protein
VLPRANLRFPFPSLETTSSLQAVTGVYLDILHKIATSGTTFKDKNTLLTGVGKGFIGVEVVKGLLSGGAHIVIMTSSYRMGIG